MPNASKSLFLNSSAKHAFWYYFGQLNLHETVPFEKFEILRAERLQGLRIGTIADGLDIEQGRFYAKFRYALDIFDDKGIFKKSLIVSEISRLRGFFKDTPLTEFSRSRLWLFISHNEDPSFESFLTSYFDSQGERLETFAQKGASLYLYAIR